MAETRQLSEAGTVAPPDSPLPWLDDLHLFLAELRTFGFTIGVAEEIRGVHLLERLIARGIDLSDPEQAAAWLGPIFCTTPREQQIFRDRLRVWATAHLSTVAASTDAGGPTTSAITVEAIDRSRRADRWSTWTAAGVGGFLILLFVVAIGSSPDAPAPVPVVPKPDVPMATLPVTTVTRQVGDWLPRLGIAALPLALAALQLRRVRGRRLALARYLTTQQPATQRVSFGVASSTLFAEGRFRNDLQVLRRHRDIASTDIDVTRSVRATAAAGGRVQLRTGTRPRLPDYLVLVDHVSAGDHLAALADVLLGRMQAEQVSVTRYDFYRDPRRARRHGERGAEGVAVELRDLFAVHGDDPLLLITDGAGLFEPLTGRLGPWVTMLQTWPLVVILTPTAPAAWGRRELELETAGFMIVPVTPSGVATIADRLRAGTEAEVTPLPRDVGRPVGQLLQQIETNPARWLLETPPAPDVVATLVAELREHLGPGTFKVLGAVAVFPAVRPELTLHLGNVLQGDGQRLLDEGGMGALSQLPWMRHCRIPDWLRTALIRALPEEDSQHVREACRGLIPGDGATSDAAFALDIAAPYRRAWSDILFERARHEPQSSLRDVIFLSFISGRRIPDLVVEAPPTLRSLFLTRIPPVEIAIVGVAALAAVLLFALHRRLLDAIGSVWTRAVGWVPLIDIEIIQTGSHVVTVVMIVLAILGWHLETWRPASRASLRRWLRSRRLAGIGVVFAALALVGAAAPGGEGAIVLMLAAMSVLHLARTAMPPPGAPTAGPGVAERLSNLPWTKVLLFAVLAPLPVIAVHAVEAMGGFSAAEGIAATLRLQASIGGLTLLAVLLPLGFARRWLGLDWLSVIVMAVAFTEGHFVVAGLVTDIPVPTERDSAEMFHALRAELEMVAGGYGIALGLMRLRLAVPRATLPVFAATAFAVIVRWLPLGTAGNSASYAMGAVLVPWTPILLILASAFVNRRNTVVRPVRLTLLAMLPIVGAFIGLVVAGLTARGNSGAWILAGLWLGGVSTVWPALRLALPGVWAPHVPHPQASVARRRWPTYVLGISLHLFLAGSGLLYADRRLKRGWLYPLLPIAGAVALGIRESFDNPLVEVVAGVLSVVWLLTTFDVIRVLRRRFDEAPPLEQESLARARRLVDSYVPLLVGAIVTNVDFQLSRSFALSLSIVPVVLTVLAACRYGRRRATTVAASVAVTGTLALLALSDDRAVVTLLFGSDFQAWRVPHAGLMPSLRLISLGYAAGWFVERVLPQLIDRHRDANTIERTQGVGAPINALFAGTLLIVLANVSLLVAAAPTSSARALTFPPGALAVVVAVAVGMGLGAHAGARCGAGALALSWVLNLVLVASGVRRLQLEFHDLGHIAAFALVGYLGGRVAEALRGPGIAGWIAGAGGRASVVTARRWGRSWAAGALLVLLSAWVSVDGLGLSLRFNLDVLVIPAAALAGMRLGAMRGFRVTLISQIVVVVVGALAQYLDWHVPLFVGDDLTVTATTLARSSASVLVLAIVAWMAGTMDLAGNSQRRLDLAVIAFALYEVAGVVRWGLFPTSYATLTFDEIPLTAAIDLGWLLSPWVTAALLALALAPSPPHRPPQSPPPAARPT